ncbi:MAG TPA: two-component sensor histidine kinase, partial [Streptosporangiaceae bacterium]
AFAAYQLLGYPPSFGGEGLLLALYAAGAHEDSFRGELITGATASYVVLAVALDGLGSPERPVDYVVFYLALSACWGAGALIQARQSRKE